MDSLAESTLAVVAYPVLGKADGRWIERVRARHDPQAARIPAHITLVFPVVAAEQVLVDQLVRSAREFAPMSLMLGEATAARDTINGGAYVCLPVQTGRAEIVAIHDALYLGALAIHRRHDVPFEPHLTVGAHPDIGECERIAGRLSADGRVVSARIEDVSVVEVGTSTVRTTARIPLGGSTGPASILR